MLAEEQQQWQSAQDYLLKALSLFVEFNDSHNVSIALGYLARLYQATEDNTLLAVVAEVLGVSVKEAAQMLSTVR